MMSFDYWAFAISWAPAFCCRNSERCRREQYDKVGNSLVAHGLWPMREDRTQVVNCKYADRASWQLKGRKLHEYKKHGSCTELSSSLYFALEDQIMKRSEIKDLENTILVNSKPESLVFGSSHSHPSVLVLDVAHLHGPTTIGVKASRLCQLQELLVCFEKTQSGLVGQQINCPDSALAFAESASNNQCRHLIVESAAVDTCKDKCSFIAKELQRNLKAPTR